jgi:hypothetical protein
LLPGAGFNGNLVGQLALDLGLVVRDQLEHGRDQRDRRHERDHHAAGCDDAELCHADEAGGHKRKEGKRSGEVYKVQAQAPSG